LNEALREIGPSFSAFLISFVLAGTSLLGRYDREPVALRIYGLILVTVALMRMVIWLYTISRPHLLWQRPDDRQRLPGWW
jgi:hypothetical protein